MATLKAGDLIERFIGEVLGLLACSIQEPRSPWSVCSHNLALIQISGRAAISWMSISTSGKERIWHRARSSCRFTQFFGQRLGREGRLHSPRVGEA